MFEGNLVQKSQNDHNSCAGAYAYLNMEHSYYGNHNIRCCSTSDSDSWIPDEPKDKMRNNFSENINALFDEDADEDQLVLCYNICEKGFHIVLKPLYE